MLGLGISQPVFVGFAMVQPLVLAILLLGGEPERDTFAAELAFQFQPPLEVFASSPSAGALQRLQALDRINKLVLSFEALDTVTNFSTMIPRLQEEPWKNH